MSSEHHNTEHQDGQPLRHTDVAFEAADINTRTILAYLLYLGLSVVIAFAVSVYIYRFATKLATDYDTPLTPSHKNVGPTMPPEPMLQGVPGHVTDPQFDLRAKIKRDSEANETLKPLEGQPGFAQIPVEDAMKIIVSKGLPAAVAAPEAERKK